RLLEGTFSSEGFTVVTAPITSVFFCSPNATTTTSSRVEVAIWSSRLIKLCSPTGISRLSKPISENTNIPPLTGTSSTYRPFRSVLVPMLALFFRETETPGRGAPLVSVTLPVTCRSCKCGSADQRNSVPEGRPGLAQDVNPCRHSKPQAINKTYLT